MPVDDIGLDSIEINDTVHFGATFIAAVDDAHCDDDSIAIDEDKDCLVGLLVIADPEIELL